MLVVVVHAACCGPFLHEFVLSRGDDHDVVYVVKGHNSWHSGEMLDWQAPEVAALGTTILEKLHHLLWLEHDGMPCVETAKNKCLGQQNATFHVAISMWANVLGDGGYNILHSHNFGNAMSQHWSGVFYVDTPPCAAGHDNCGMFEYFETRGDMFPFPCVKKDKIYLLLRGGGKNKNTEERTICNVSQVHLLILFSSINFIFG